MKKSAFAATVGLVLLPALNAYCQVGQPAPVTAPAPIPAPAQPAPILVPIPAVITPSPGGETKSTSSVEASPTQPNVKQEDAPNPHSRSKTGKKTEDQSSTNNREDKKKIDSASASVSPATQASDSQPKKTGDKSEIRRQREEAERAEAKRKHDYEAPPNYPRDSQQPSSANAGDGAAYDSSSVPVRPPALTAPIPARAGSPPP
jgi:hypothetical protein